MQLADLLRSSRNLSVNTKCGELNIVYSPSAYTAEVEAILLEAGQKPISTLCKILAGLLKEWDLMDGERMYPISEDSLARLPAQFLLTVMQAIAEDMRPNPPSQPA